MKNPKLIFLDLDGTLLSNNRVITTRNIEVLSKCHQKGIKIGFCTSRGESTIREFVKQVCPDIIITNGGATARIGNNRIFTNGFSLNETQILFNKAYEVCGIDCEITADTIENIYWNRHLNKSVLYANEAIFDDFKHFSQNVLKICVQTLNYEKISEIKNSIEDCVAIKFSDIPWYKFSKKNATKENAVLEVCNYLNVETNSIASFGDDFSDLNMLKLSGISVAMGNAIPEVKDVADFVADNNEDDGVATWLESNVLE